jgi:hypothetical protein
MAQFTGLLLVESSSVIAHQEGEGIESGFPCSPIEG